MKEHIRLLNISALFTTFQPKRTLSYLNTHKNIATTNTSEKNHLLITIQKTAILPPLLSAVGAQQYCINTILQYYTKSAYCETISCSSAHHKQIRKHRYRIWNIYKQHTDRNHQTLVTFTLNLTQVTYTKIKY